MSDFFQHVLVLRPGPFPRLDTALAMGPPDEAGFVKLYESVAWPDGLTDKVPANYCYVYDADLAKLINTLVDGASDSVDQATNIIIAHAANAFSTEPAEGEPKVILH
jgi:hypothetical protein